MATEGRAGESFRNEEEKSLPERPTILTIRAYSPGAIPIGAELYRDDRTHLAQVGTDTIEAPDEAQFGVITGTDGRRGLAVHPLTIPLHESAVEVLDQHPEVERWTLLWYASDDQRHGVLGIAPAGGPLPDAAASLWAIHAVDYRQDGGSLVLSSADGIAIDVSFNLREQRFELVLELSAAGARKLAEGAGLARIGAGQRCLLSIHSHEPDGFARSSLLDLEPSVDGTGRYTGTASYELRAGPLSDGHLFLSALRQAEDGGRGSVVRLQAI